MATDVIESVGVIISSRARCCLPENCESIKGRRSMTVSTDILLQRVSLHAEEPN